MKEQYLEFKQKLLELAIRWVKVRPNFGCKSPESAELNGDFITFTCFPTSSGALHVFKISSKYLNDDSSLEKDSLDDFNEQKNLMDEISRLERSEDVQKLKTLKFQLSMVNGNYFGVFR